MRLLDARRLLGPNNLHSAPVVVVEVELGAVSLDRFRPAYGEEVARLSRWLGLPVPGRFFEGGSSEFASLAFEADVDCMLAWAEVAELAALRVIANVTEQPSSTLEPKPSEAKLAELAALFTAQKNPRLLTLLAAAKARGLAAVWEDETLTLGLGQHSRTYPLNALPKVDEIFWDELAEIPVALVTGTNGKTTTTRLLGHIARLHFGAVGVCSTDGITLLGKQVEEGDWTGPSAARLVLQDRRVKAAVLETARGGILRRGLALSGYQVGILTNVESDHLGTDGIHNLSEMAAVKAVVANAVAPHGTVVLNASDSRLREIAKGSVAAVVYFADLECLPLLRVDAATMAIEAHCAEGGSAVVSELGHIVLRTGPEKVCIASISQIPMSFDGAARYNVENALAAVAGAIALGIPHETIARGLISFTAMDNPGRGELYDIEGVRVLLDFAHNAAGIAAVLALATALAKRGGHSHIHTVIAGSPGDRSVTDIENVVDAIVKEAPLKVIVRELSEYLRGRDLGEIPALFATGFAARGCASDYMQVASSEVSALTNALAAAQVGDIVVLLAHVEREAVRDLLMRLAAVIVP